MSKCVSDPPFSSVKGKMISFDWYINFFQFFQLVLYHQTTTVHNA
jgi:hypothetical protein